MVSRPACTLSMKKFTGYEPPQKGASIKKRTCALTPGSVEPTQAAVQIAATAAKSETFIIQRGRRHSGEPLPRPHESGVRDEVTRSGAAAECVAREARRTAHERELMKM